MALAVPAVSFNTDGASSPVVVNTPSGTTSGDYLLAVHQQDQFETKAAMTAPAGWALHAQFGTDGGGSNSLLKIWWLLAGGSEPSTYTFGQAGASIVTILRITGQHATTPVNVAPQFSTGSSDPSHIAPAITPTTADVLLICGASFGTGGTHPLSYTPPAGMTEASDADTGYQVGSVCYQFISGGSGVSTGTKTFTSSDAGAFATVSMAIAPAAAASAGLPRPPVMSRLAVAQAGSW